MKPVDPNLDLASAAQRQAMQDVSEGMKNAMPLAVAAPAPDNSGDFLLIGKHPLGLASCAIRLNQVQALMLASQMSGMVGQAMAAAAQGMSRKITETKS